MTARPLQFLRLHQKKKPVYIETESIRQIHTAAKGSGSYIVTDMEGSELEVDERQDDIIKMLTDLDIEVILFTNDDDADDAGA